MSETKKKRSAIAVRGITKSFRIPLDGSSGIKQKIVNVFRNKKGYRDFTPLKDVSFEINEGEFFGIVGRNGSGKSTLLKTIAGIYTPDTGHVKVNGLLVPFIELGVGFNPELSGRENVYLNAALLGFSRSETEAVYEEIVDFAELHDFMEERLKNYSSGMQVRLAFSIAIQAKGDILLLDEVLAVGDESFQRKCFEYFANLKTQKKTVVLVTHSMSAVEQYCDRAILLDDGSIKAQGSSIKVAEAYRNLFIKNYVKDENSKNNIDDNNSLILLNSVNVSQNDNKEITVSSKSGFTVNIELHVKEDVGESACGINIINSLNQIIIASGIGTLHDKKMILKKGKHLVSFYYPVNILTNDSYYINVAVAKGLQQYPQELILQKTNSASFEIIDVINRPHALTQPKVEVSHHEI